MEEEKVDEHINLQKYVQENLLRYGAADPSVTYPRLCCICKKFCFPVETMIKFPCHCGHAGSCIPITNKGNCGLCNKEHDILKK